jgi:hypothetical protein
MGTEIMRLAWESEGDPAVPLDYCSRWNNAFEKAIIEPTFRPTLGIDATWRGHFTGSRDNRRPGVSRSIEMADETEHSPRGSDFEPIRHNSVAEPVRVDAETGKPHRNGESPLEAPLNARQLAEILPLHPVTILKWARQGKIPCHRLSPRKIVFLPSEITRWLSDYTNKAVRAA